MLFASTISISPPRRCESLEENRTDEGCFQSINSHRSRRFSAVIFLSTRRRALLSLDSDNSISFQTSHVFFACRSKLFLRLPRRRLCTHSRDDRRRVPRTPPSSRVGIRHSSRFRLFFSKTQRASSPPSVTSRLQIHRLTTVVDFYVRLAGDGLLLQMKLS